VGSTGEGTYWREIVDYVKADKELVSELAFVGHSFEGLKLYVDTLCDPRIKCLPTVPHGELNELYSSYDVGLILYKPIDLNTELAAPNKLYEFWANGLPVLAPKLSGLCSQIDNPVFGVMVDLRSSADVTNALTRFRDNLNGPVSRKDLQNIFAARWDQTHFVTPLVESWLS
jgi:glycosyltransferase involved in cell wall biosynthesis